MSSDTIRSARAAAGDERLTGRLVLLQDALISGSSATVADLLDRIEASHPAEHGRLCEHLRDAGLMERVFRGDVDLVPLVLGRR